MGKWGSGWGKVTQSYQAWLAPAAPSTSGGADQFDFGTAVPANLANIVQPDYPRNVVINVTGTLSAMSITVTGTDARGNAVTETFTGHADETGSVAFAQISSITINSQTGGAGGEKLDIGYGAKLGLINPIGSSSNILKILEDGADAAVSGATISATYGTITFATEPNNTHNYEVFYASI